MSNMLCACGADRTPRLRKKVTLEGPLKLDEVEDLEVQAIKTDSEIIDIRDPSPPPKKSPSYTPNPNAPNLEEEVDLLETGLARCVSDFRAHAEEIVAKHLAVLEEVQAIHSSEMKPLPAQSPIDPSPGAGRKGRRNPSAPTDPLAVLPGVPGEEKPKAPRDDDDSDSENEETGKEDDFDALGFFGASDVRRETESSMPFREEDDDYEEPVSHGWILNPDSNIRISWDLGSLIMVMIPMQAYTLPENLFLDFMEWTTRLFWTLDIFFSCFTGELTLSTWLLCIGLCPSSPAAWTRSRRPVRWSGSSPWPWAG
eukprot:g33417.t1